MAVDILPCWGLVPVPFVRDSPASMDWMLIGEDNNESGKKNCHVMSMDRAFKENAFLMYHKWQRISHFAGMVDICNKPLMVRYLNIMRREFPKEYNFHPMTYIIPQDYGTFKLLFPSGGQSKVTYIIKPSRGAQGKEMFLKRRLEDVYNLGTVCVAQLYIIDPLLINRRKFDLRIYVLVTLCSPLHIYLFRDGLVRMCA
jgi:tubulin polyglutamylase TTLL6/13